MTISFWICPFGWSERYCPGIVSKKKADADRGYVIYGDGNLPGKINIRVTGDEGMVGMASASDVDDEVWQCWAVTFDPASKTLTWYKNGKFDKKASHCRVGDMTNDAQFHIGYAQIWNGNYSCRIREFKIFNRTLSADEIAADFDANRSMIEGAPEMPDLAPAWRVVTTRYPATDYVVAGCTVQEAGAKGDGKTDDTLAFKRAMHSMALAGGGTVFVPVGRYVIKGNLEIPMSVTLRGDWEAPTPGKPIQGTILMAYAGRGQTEGRPFIGLSRTPGS